MTNVETRVLLAEAQARVAELEAKLAEECAATLGACELGDHLSRKLVRADRRIAELGAENATLRERFTGMWQRLAEVAGVSEQPADCTTDEAWLLLFMKLSEVMTEGARELQAHERKDAAVLVELGTIADNLSQLQAQARAL